MRWPFYRRSKSCSVPSSSSRKSPFSAGHVWSGCGVVRTKSWNSVECGMCCMEDLEEVQQGSGDPVEEASRESSGGCLWSLKEANVCSTDKWTRNPEFLAEGCSAGGGLEANVDCRVRTADWRLAQLGRKALDRGLISPLEKTTQAEVQITGDQGQVWSTNPVYSTEIDINCLYSSAAHRRDACKSQMSHLQSASDFINGYDWDASSIANALNGEGMQSEQSLDTVIQCGGKYTCLDDTMDLDVFDIDTPRFERRIVTKPSSKQYSGRSTSGNIEHLSVQTESRCVESPGSLLNSTGYFSFSPSVTRMHELVELKQRIEENEEDLMDSFAMLSDSFSPCPNITSMDEIRNLQTMVEEKDIQIIRLYSQVYEEVSKAQQSIKHQWMQAPIPSKWERCSPEVTHSAPHGLEYYRQYSASDSSSLSEQEDCSPRNPPSSEALMRISEYPIAFSSPTSSVGDSSFDMHSESSYTLNEELPGVCISYQKLMERIQDLENDVKEKEALISQKDSIIRHMLTNTASDVCSTKSRSTLGYSRDLHALSDSIDENHQPYSRQYVKTAVQAEELEQLFVQQNPP